MDKNNNNSDAKIKMEYIDSLVDAMHSDTKNGTLPKTHSLFGESLNKPLITVSLRNSTLKITHRGEEVFSMKVQIENNNLVLDTPKTPENQRGKGWGTFGKLIALKYGEKTGANKVILSTSITSDSNAYSYWIGVAFQKLADALSSTMEKISSKTDNKEASLTIRNLGGSTLSPKNTLNRHHSFGG